MFLICIFLIEPSDGVLSCRNGNDPFYDITPETFTPPLNANLKDVRRWKEEVANVVGRIAKLKIGGNALRLTIEKEVSELKKLRLEIFCMYLDT